jgi:hypothetical protein
MNCLRHLSVVGVMLAMAAGCGDSDPPVDALGQISIRTTTQPSDVTAIHIVVSAIDLPGPIEGDLALSGGSWSGSLPAVPPGSGRTVTAHAYRDVTEIYRGATGNVSVFSGELTFVAIHLLPYPNDTGGSGINTPPHFASLDHVDAIHVNEASNIVVSALDPDDNTLLTYTLSATPGGTFWDSNIDANDDGNIVTNRQSGEPVVVSYTPPEDFTGFALIQVSVSDGQATTTTTFSIAVGAGITPGVDFAVLPDLAISSVAPQAVMPGASSQIMYTFTNPTNNAMRVHTTWSDECGGTFTSENDATVDIAPNDSVLRTVTYTATSFTPSGVSNCLVRLAVIDDAGASMWSTMNLWIEQPFTVFVSGFTVQGATFAGQIEAADAACQADAVQGSVPGGIYRALLSFDQISAKDRLLDGPYILQNGDAVARNKAELFSQDLLNPIHLDATGVDVDGAVFTGTAGDGSASFRCSSWTTSDNGQPGMMGSSHAHNAGWTAAEAPPCDTFGHVYCVQQSRERD